MSPTVPRLHATGNAKAIQKAAATKLRDDMSREALKNHNWCK